MKVYLSHRLQQLIEPATRRTTCTLLSVGAFHRLVIRTKLKNILAPLWQCIALKCKHGQLGIGKNSLTSKTVGYFSELCYGHFSLIVFLTGNTYIFRYPLGQGFLRIFLTSKIHVLKEKKSVSCKACTTAITFERLIFFMNCFYVSTQKTLL